MTLAHSRRDDAYEETVVPRAGVRFPLKLPVPEGFDPGREETWPNVVGRLEYVDGDLWFMPPCGLNQQVTVSDVVKVLGVWRGQHEEFIVGTNEAGMKLDEDVRGADVAVWRRAAVGRLDSKFARVPPILAVEIAGRDDTLELLRDKARWYFDHGVEAVWLLDPTTATVHVLATANEHAFQRGERIPEIPALPGLSPLVDDLFRQLGST